MRPFGRAGASLDQVVRAELPDAIDLLILAVGAGLTVGLAVEAVGRQLSGPLADACGEVSRRRALGRSTAEALAVLPEMLGEPLRPLTTVLIHADRYGIPLVPQLERLAVEARAERRRRAETAARRAPVQLVFPLVLCCLPAFALLTVVPVLLAALQSFRH